MPHRHHALSPAPHFEAWHAYQWTTNDLSVLQKCHNSIVHLVQEIGISGMMEAAE